MATEVRVLADHCFVERRGQACMGHLVIVEERCGSRMFPVKCYCEMCGLLYEPTVVLKNSFKG